jgi:hypothetical protein
MLPNLRNSNLWVVFTIDLLIISNCLLHIILDPILKQQPHLQTCMPSVQRYSGSFQFIRPHLFSLSFITVCGATPAYLTP